MVGSLVFTKTTQPSKLSVGVVCQRLQKTVFPQKVEKSNVKVYEIDEARFCLNICPNVQKKQTEGFTKLS